MTHTFETFVPNGLVFSATWWHTPLKHLSQMAWYSVQPYDTDLWNFCPKQIDIQCNLVTHTFETISPNGLVVSATLWHRSLKLLPQTTWYSVQPYDTDLWTFCLKQPGIQCNFMTQTLEPFVPNSLVFIATLWHRPLKHLSQMAWYSVQPYNTHLWNICPKMAWYSVHPFDADLWNICMQWFGF